MLLRDPRRAVPQRDHSLDINNDSDHGSPFDVPSFDVPAHPGGEVSLWIAIAFAVLVAYRLVRALIERRSG